MSKPCDEACLASEATPLEAGFAAPRRCNQRESHGGIGHLFLVTSLWANQVVAEWNELSWPKKGEQALIVPRRESSDLNLEDRVGQLRGLLRLLL